MKSKRSEDETVSNAPQSRKSSLMPKFVRHDMKHFIFYDTFVTRQDLITMSTKDIDGVKSYLVDVVMKRFEDTYKERGFMKEKGSSAFALITFEHTPNNSVSKATKESQNMCRHSIFSEFLSNIHIYCKVKAFNFEQQSTLLSICFYVFVESLERKKNQIDSYEQFKKILKAQILLTNAQNLPQFNQAQILDFNALIVDTFYKYQIEYNMCVRYYSLYELRMTIYQEVNIYPKPQGVQPDANVIDEDDNESHFIEDDSYEEESGEGFTQREEQSYVPQQTAASKQAEKILDEQLSSFNERLEQRAKEKEEQMLKEAQESLQPPKKK